MDEAPLVEFAFSPERAAALQDLWTSARTGDVNAIRDAWAKHLKTLGEARGLFTVADKRWNLPVVGEQQFGPSGLLQSWLASQTAIPLVAPAPKVPQGEVVEQIFCDTNFVSFCRAHNLGRDLGANEAGFLKAVAFVRKHHSVSPLPYLLENTSQVESPVFFETLRAFGIVAGQMPAGKADAYAQRLVTQAKTADHALTYAHFRNHYRFCLVTLQKAALISFKSRASVDKKMFELMTFFHEGLARLRTFLLEVGHQFFLKGTALAFFRGVQSNARALDATLRGMAWDLAMRQSCLETLLVRSSAPHRSLTFPIPYLLSFDRPMNAFSQLFSLRALIYWESARRVEYFHSDEVVLPTSHLMQGPCGTFISREAIADRANRVKALDENQRLAAVENELSREIAALLP